MCCTDVRGHHHHAMGHRHSCCCGCPGPFDGTPRQITREQGAAGLKRRLGRLEAELKALQEEMDSMQSQT